MINFKQEISKQISEVTKIDWEELANYLEVPPDTKLGDYAFPCFKLARTLKKAPPIIATEIKEKKKKIQLSKLVGAVCQKGYRLGVCKRACLSCTASDKGKSKDFGKFGF